MGYLSMHNFWLIKRVCVWKPWHGKILRSVSIRHYLHYTLGFFLLFIIFLALHLARCDEVSPSYWDARSSSFQICWTKWCFPERNKTFHQEKWLRKRSLLGRRCKESWRSWRGSSWIHWVKIRQNCSNTNKHWSCLRSIIRFSCRLYLQKSKLFT